MSAKGRVAPMALATCVGAMVGLALSPIPVFFDAEWLAWLLVPTFAVTGTILSFIFLSAADK